MSVITKAVPGLLIAAPDEASFIEQAKSRIEKLIRDKLKMKARVSVALSGGNTPKPVYALLAAESIDWSRIDLFLVDERGVPSDHARSNVRMVRETLVAPANVDAFYPMNGGAADLAAEASRYESLLRQHVPADRDGIPSIDLVVLGIGDDGHTASLFPGEPTVNELHKLVVSVPAKGEREARLSLTAPMIEHAGAIVVLAVGAAKQAPIERVWEVSGDLSATPARILRRAHGAITWIIDRAAGGLG